MPTATCGQGLSNFENSLFFTAFLGSQQHNRNNVSLNFTVLILTFIFSLSLMHRGFSRIYGMS